MRCPRANLTLAALLLTLGVIVAGCGSGGRADPATGAVACRTTIMTTIDAVARRAYSEVASGRVITGSVHEAEHAKAFIGAVASGDPAATVAAARTLMDGTQIAFLRVLRGRRTLVDLGQGPAIAPAGGSLGPAARPVGRFVVAVQGDAGYAAVVKGLTGADVFVRQDGRQLAGTLSPGPRSIPAAGTVRYAGASYLAYSFTAPAYPVGMERISLLAPMSVLAACAPTATQTEADVLGPMAQRIYAHESSSTSARQSVGYMAHQPAFIQAVATADPAATRAAIVTFFRSHRHIVRVRAMHDGKLVDDVGGPYVLAPIFGVLRIDGVRVGGFLTAIQDDAGYVALTRIYSGAQVILRIGKHQIPSSTLNPGPRSIPARGAVSYAGRRYEAYSFNGVAFPRGTLRISLLVPVSG